MEERVQEYLKSVEVPLFEPTDEQRVAMQNGDFSAMNEYNTNAHRHMHMQNLQVVNKLVNSALESAKKDFIAQANVNNTAVDVMNTVKSKFPAQTNDKIVGPVIESMVSKMMSSGEHDINKITNEVGKTVKYMGTVLGDDGGKKTTDGNRAVDNVFTEKPDNWTDFLKQL